MLYESTGQNGRSWIRKVRLETGEVLQQSPLEPQYFGEGIVAWKKTLIQLTYTTEIGFVYDLRRSSGSSRSITRRRAGR